MARLPCGEWAASFGHGKGSVEEKARAGATTRFFQIGNRVGKIGEAMSKPMPVSATVKMVSAVSHRLRSRRRSDCRRA